MRALTASSRSALISLVAVTTLSSCVLTNGPEPMSFGFRMEGGKIAVAVPLCPSDAVFGAESYVSVDGEGDGDGFRELWSASGPRSPEVGRGVFFVNSDQSFSTVEKPLSTTPPNRFYVDTREGTEGQVKESGSSFVDLRKLKSAELADDEYMTWSGKVMTRKEINAQRRCNKD